jgi:hypothetical protein
VLGAGASGSGAPLDGFTQPSGAYSFRKLRSAYTGSAFRIKRASDLAELDIGFVGYVPGLGAPWDEAAATAHCAATTCSITIAYDQSGNGRDLPQSTTAPVLVLGGAPNSLAHARMTSAAFGFVSAGSFTPATGVVSMSVVARRAVGTGACVLFRENGALNRMQATAAAATWQVVGGTVGSIVAAAPDAAWHAATAVIDTTGSVLNIDGTETAGSVTGNTTPGLITVQGGATTTCDQAEWVFWDNYTLTPAERTALSQNQRDYWMPAPLDTFASPSGAYSFRKLKSAYSGPAIRIRRASDNLETDINFLGYVPGLGSPWDEAAAAAHCAATTCFLRTWYDQSGAGKDLVQTVAANQPSLVFNCKGSLPCWRISNVGTVTLVTTSTTPATGVVSFSAVASRDSGAGNCFWLRQNGNLNKLQTGTANFWNLIGGTSGTVAAAAADGAWHAAQGVLNAASSSLTIDGTATTGTATGIVTAGVTGILGSTTSVCSGGEAILWDAYPLTTTEIAALTANQRSFWGTP